MATQFSGGTYVNTTFTGAIRQDIQSNIKAQLVIAGWTNVAQASAQGPGNVGTVTMTIASPAVVTFASHGFLGGERILLQTTGALPTGLSVNTVYFVKFIDANTFNLSTTSGGSNINTSGSQSGTHTLNSESILLQSATQGNVTNPIRVRLKDNRGFCIQVSIENQAGTVAGLSGGNNGGHLLPAASKTFKIIATKYHFLCFTPGVSLGREFVMAGMLYVPSLLTGITDHGYMLCNSFSDSDGTLCATLRSAMTAGSTGNSGDMQFIWNSSLLEVGGSTSQANIGYPQFVLPNSRASQGLRWANDALNGADVLVSAGLTAVADEGKIKGQFYDMEFIAAPLAIDTADTFNGHTWQNLSNNLTLGGIWVATS